MIKRISVLVFFFLGFISITTAQENNLKKFVGTWVGIYEGDGQTYTATLAIKEENGKLTGIAESTESPTGEPMAMENIVVDGNKLKFEIMSAIKYEGVLNADKKIIEGMLTGMDGQVVKLNLAQKEVAAKAGNYKNFIGTWNAKVDSGEGEKFFILVLTEKEGKLTGTLESPEQNTGQIQLDNVVGDGDKLSFEIQMANVTYVGVYKESKKTIEGTGTENQSSTTINFVKDEKKPVK